MWTRSWRSSARYSKVDRISAARTVKLLSAQVEIPKFHPSDPDYEQRMKEMEEQEVRRQAKEREAEKGVRHKFLF